MRKDYDFTKGKRGPVISSPGKTRVTIMLDNEVLDFFRARAAQRGSGYQTMINAALREFMSEAEGRGAEDRPVTLADLRKELRKLKSI